MAPPANTNPIGNEPAGRPDARRHGRLRAESVNCSLGNVVNLSASGMRVATRRRRGVNEGDLITTELVLDDFRLQVKGRVAWVRRAGLLRYELGLQFVDVTPQIEEGVRRLARSAAVAVHPALRA